MALKADAETVADKASRIATIIARSQMLLAQGSLTLDENPDLVVPFSPDTRQAWKDKIAALKEDIKQIVSGW